MPRHDAHTSPLVNFALQFSFYIGFSTSLRRHDFEGQNPGHLKSATIQQTADTQQTSPQHAINPIIYCKTELCHTAASIFFSKLPKKYSKICISH
jgi:hypothetical protein